MAKLELEVGTDVLLLETGYALLLEVGPEPPAKFQGGNEGYTEWVHPIYQLREWRKTGKVPRIRKW